MILQSHLIAVAMALTSPTETQAPQLASSAAVSDGTMYYRRYFASAPVPPGGLGPAVGESTDSCEMLGSPPEPTVVTTTTGTVTPHVWESVIGSCPGGLI